ncbi:MAG: hypothetical protein JSS42_13075 [Proteobacteria bacterium]|nr:hypothetical protein [Pseudomonadota bacterium]
MNLTDNPESLQSGVLTSAADPLLGDAIAQTLRAPAAQRERIFTGLVGGIEAFMATQPQERPWTCTMFRGTDGSAIFRGGVGHSLVIDPCGHLWRARSYEDFATTYTFVGNTCEIDTLTPLYAQMREYRPKQPAASAAVEPGFVLEVELVAQYPK